MSIKTEELVSSSTSSIEKPEKDTSDSDTDDSTVTLESFSDLLEKNPIYYRHVLDLEYYIKYHQACFSHKFVVFKPPSNLQIKHLKEKTPILAAIYSSYADKFKVTEPIGQINDEVYISKLTDLVAGTSEHPDNIPILNQHMFRFSNSYTQLGPHYRPPPISQYNQRSSFNHQWPPQVPQYNQRNRFDHPWPSRSRPFVNNRHMYPRGYYPNYVRPQLYRASYPSPSSGRNLHRQRSPSVSSDLSTQVPENPHLESFPTPGPTKKELSPIQTEIKTNLEDILSSEDEIKPDLATVQGKKVVPRHIRKRNKKLAKKTHLALKIEVSEDTK